VVPCARAVATPKTRIAEKLFGNGVAWRWIPGLSADASTDHGGPFSTFYRAGGALDEADDLAPSPSPLPSRLLRTPAAGSVGSAATRASPGGARLRRRAGQGRTS